MTAIEASLLEGGRVLRIALSRPKANVLTTGMLGEIAGALREHRDAPRLKMVLLRGSGGNFSFGASVEEHRRDSVAAMLACFHDVVRAVAGFPVPVAFAVEGRCLGGAFELALAGHLLFATVDAVFACPEIKLGVFAPVLSAIGPLRLPGAVAERLSLTGEELDAPTASALGLLTSVVGRDVDVEQAALAWYRAHLDGLSAFSLRQATAAGRARIVEALGEPLARLERQYLEQLVPSHDGDEGIAAFLERRPPRWVDA